MVANENQPTKDDVVAELKRSGADVLMNYLPVGSQEATEFYAECALEAGVAFVNNIPVFIASDPVWAKKFEDAGVAIVGDDIKAQLGATIVHRVLTDLFAKRGVSLDRTYQLNTGGNTDFLNMSNRHRLASKKISKTEAVQAVAAERLADENVHIGPSRLCAVAERQQGRLHPHGRPHVRRRAGEPGNAPVGRGFSPNSAGVAIDMIRCAKIAKDRGHRRPGARGQPVFLQASARAGHRRYGVRCGRGFHRGCGSQPDLREQIGQTPRLASGRWRKPTFV